LRQQAALDADQFLDHRFGAESCMDVCPGRFTDLRRALGVAQQEEYPLSGGLVILGTVRSDATRMTIDLDANTALDTDVRAGTFIAIVPDSLVDETGQLSDDQLATLTTTIYDPKGNELYRGPLNTH